MKVLEDKYLYIFWTQIKNLLEYKFDITLKIIRPLVMTLALGSVWLVIFSVTGQESIGGFTPLTFIIYLLVIRFMASFSPGHATIMKMNEEIVKGDLVMRLVRPMHYLRWLFFKHLPIPLASGLIGIAILTLIAFFTPIPFPQGIFALIFFIALVGTVLLQYAIYLGLGVLSFWVYDIFPLERLYKNVSVILSGEMIPLTLFGAGQSIVQLLPFASIAFIPGGLYVGLFSTREAIMLVGVQWIWVLVFWIGVIYLYKRGLKRFEAQGG